jgi:hypothetical protein
MRAELLALTLPDSIPHQVYSSSPPHCHAAANVFVSLADAPPAGSHLAVAVAVSVDVSCPATEGAVRAPSRWALGRAVHTIAGCACRPRLPYAS